LHEREFSAAAKVSVKPAFGGGNCDGNHVFTLTAESKLASVHGNRCAS
jgi:hypothetical protein